MLAPDKTDPNYDVEMKRHKEDRESWGPVTIPIAGQPQPQTAVPQQSDKVKK